MIDKFLNARWLYLTNFTILGLILGSFFAKWHLNEADRLYEVFGKEYTALSHFICYSVLITLILFILVIDVICRHLEKRNK